MKNPPAPVYAVIEVQIKNPPKFMEYVKGHIPSVFQYGGKFVAEYETVRPFADAHLQGASDWNLMVVQEWPDEETFLKWWRSPEYKQWNAMRPEGADVKLTLTRKLAH